MSSPATTALSGSAFFGVGTWAASTRSAASVIGTAWTKLVNTPLANRGGVWVWNSSNSSQLIVRMAAVGGGTPSGSAVADGDFALSPRQSAYVEVGDAFDLFGLNDSGASTATTAVCNEVKRS